MVAVGVAATRTTEEELPPHPLIKASANATPIITTEKTDVCSRAMIPPISAQAPIWLEKP
jgi:hypothetical protein